MSQNWEGGVPPVAGRRPPSFVTCEHRLEGQFCNIKGGKLHILHVILSVRDSAGDSGGSGCRGCIRGFIIDCASSTARGPPRQGWRRPSPGKFPGPGGRLRLGILSPEDLSFPEPLPRPLPAAGPSRGPPPGSQEFATPGPAGATPLLATSREGPRDVVLLPRPEPFHSPSAALPQPIHSPSTAHP